MLFLTSKGEFFWMADFFQLEIVNRCVNISYNVIVTTSIERTGHAIQTRSAFRPAPIALGVRLLLRIWPAPRRDLRQPKRPHSGAATHAGPVANVECSHTHEH